MLLGIKGVFTMSWIIGRNYLKNDRKCGFFDPGIKSPHDFAIESTFDSPPILTL